MCDWCFTCCQKDRSHKPYQWSVNISNTLHTLQSSRCTIMASAAPSPPSSPSSSEPIPTEFVELKPLIKVRGATGKAEGKTKQEGGADGVRGAIGGAMDAVRDGLSDNLRNIRRATAGVIIVSTVGALYFSRPVRYTSIQADLALFGLMTSSLSHCVFVCPDAEIQECLGHSCAPVEQTAKAASQRHDCL